MNSAVFMDLPWFPLILGVAGGARERDRVAHVAEAGDVGHGALEAEAEARVRNGTVTTQVSIPVILFFPDLHLIHARVEGRQPLLALAAADDLADPRREHVHR